MTQLFRMAFRDLLRNRRRSFLSSLALAIGVALLMLMFAFVNGEMTGAMNSTIRLQSGHLQIRAETYDENKSSLKWSDLVENPDQIVQKISSLPPVIAATPRLFVSGIIASKDITAGVRVIGIDPTSKANEPYRLGLLEGQFLTLDDRDGILIGQPLAKKLDLKTGDSINVSVNNSNGDVSEQSFIVRGIYSTQTYGFDSVSVFMALPKAQTISGTENHASIIFILLNDNAQTDSVKNAIQAPGYKIVTWTEMNDLIIQTENFANSYINMFAFIILAITATVITNTLIMAVFERTREIGILSAIGMKASRIMGMFLMESSLLTIGGLVMGIIMGLLMVAWFNGHGFYIGNMGISGMLIQDTIYPNLTLTDTIRVSVISFVISLLAGMYPAVIAARMEPVEALHGGK